MIRGQKKVRGDNMEKKSICKIALVLVAASWGGGFPITKVALDSGIEPNAIMAIRFLIASILLFIFLKWKKVVITREEITLGLGAGVILGLAFSLQTVGLQYTTASKNAFITGAYVVGVPFLLWFLTKVRPQGIVYISSFICFIGIGFLSLDGDLSMNYGDLLTLVCAFFFALQIAIIGANIKEKNPIVINAFQMFSGGILTLILNIIFEDFSIITTKMNIVQVSAIGYLIICNTLIAYLVQTIAQKYVASSTASLILSTEILFGAITSMIFMGDPMNIRIVVGGLLIFFSIILSEGDFSKWKKKQTLKSMNGK